MENITAVFMKVADRAFFAQQVVDATHLLTFIVTEKTLMLTGKYSPEVAALYMLLETELCNQLLFVHQLTNFPGKHFGITLEIIKLLLFFWQQINTGLIKALLFEPVACLGC